MGDQGFISDWEVYFCELEGKPASISVDLGLEEVAPLNEKAQVFELIVGCKTADEDGFPTDETEWDILGQIEDALVYQFVGELGANFAGKTLHDGKRSFYFYSNHEALLEVFASNVMQQFEGYSYNANTQKDPDWSLYFDFLFPEPPIMQTIQNGRLIKHMEEQGDQAHIPRKISHMFYFPTEQNRKDFITASGKAGYTLEAESADDAGEEMPYRLTISKYGLTDEASVNETSMELWQMAEDHGGQYDGWEAALIKEND